jgi:hypothetical protein
VARRVGDFRLASETSLGWHPVPDNAAIKLVTVQLPSLHACRGRENRIAGATPTISIALSLLLPAARDALCCATLQGPEESQRGEVRGIIGES